MNPKAAPALPPAPQPSPPKPVQGDWVERVEWTHAWLMAHLSNGL